MSILPNSSLTFLKTSLIWSRFVTSILIASDLRPIFRISSAVALEWTQPCENATWASMLPCDSAVCCRLGSSSTSTSVMTTSAPMPASVSASCLPRPRDAPVTTATLPDRSNIRYPLNLMVARCPASLRILCRRFGQHGLAALVYGLDVDPAGARGLGAEGHGVARNHHAGEAHRQAAQARRPARCLGRDRGRDPHLEHPVRDDARQAHRPREVVVEVDRVVVAGRFRIRRDLLSVECHLALAHERITNSARERHTGWPCASVVSVSRETKRIPRRLVSEATRPREVTVSPTRGCRCHSNSCSACRRRAKSTAASSSPNSCGAVKPSE